MNPRKQIVQPQTGASSLSPTGDASMYIETSLNISGDENVFVSCERTDIIKVSNITFLQ